ncbi:MAG TPA: hypothetical protein VFI25_05965 [Planctomycetota bacterium]|jgi:hypothetical protein|nr:hypothetical protein [Planctomycetota bacterium]
MDPRTRKRLSAAAREFVAAEPWRILSPAHLVGIRDEESGRLACALVLGRKRKECALFLGLGPEAFEPFFSSWREIASGWDLPEGGEGFIFSTISRRDLVLGSDTWESLGAWRGVLLGVCSCAPEDEIGPPSEEEAGFLARALSALARWAGPGCAKSFLVPPPAFPVLTLAERGGLEIRESLESIAPPGSWPLPLLIRPEIRDSIPSVATVDAYFLHFPPYPGHRGEESSRVLVLFDHARGKVVAAEVVPEEGFESRAGEALLDALAGNLQCSAPPPRPWRIVTDCRPFYEHAREAVESLGIKFFHRMRIPSLRGHMDEVWDELELTHERQYEFRRRCGRRE